MGECANRAWRGHAVIREIARRHMNALKAGPSFRSSERSKLALVVEGGGMRGVYSGGVLVAMEELGLSRIFDEVYAESAGATNACYFLAGQASYGIRIYTEDLASLRFINPLRLRKMLDIDYAIDVVVRRIKPLDVQAVLSSPSSMYIALTSAITGESRLIDIKRDGVPLLTSLKATAAIVPLFNSTVLVDGTRYVDGGIANPIPLQSAIDNGCTHILVLLTRPPNFRASEFTLFERICLLPASRHWSPAFREAFCEQHPGLYNRTRDIALGRIVAEPGVHIAVISPGPRSPKVRRTTLAVKTLEAAITDAMRRTREAFRGFIKA